MKARVRQFPILVLCVLICIVCPLQAQAPAEATVSQVAFTYQGAIRMSGSPLSGVCDLRFTLWNDAAAGSLLGTFDAPTVQVTRGVFTVRLSFASTTLDGGARWLGIEVRYPAGIGAYTALSPRQELTPSPMAWIAQRAVTGPFWSLAGNAGTSPGIDYIGTTDNTSLELRVNGILAFRIEPNALSPNLFAGYSGNGKTLGTVAGATIGGGGEAGQANQTSDNYAVIAGGLANRAGNSNGTESDARFATVGGGSTNRATAEASTVSGGASNAASGTYASVSGGSGNLATGQNAAIGGGYGNSTSGQYAAVGGGIGNQANASFATVAGGYENLALGERSTVAGGRGNTADAYSSTVGGGQGNHARATRATISGGQDNQANAVYSSIAGGQNNVITFTASQSVVAGGYGNQVRGQYSTVGGGYSNDAGSDYVSIVGGYDGAAAGSYATVLGGSRNSANGAYSLAAGRRAQALSNGCFVWADSTDSDITCANSNRWVVRASGGVYFYSNSTTTSGVYLAPGASSWSAVPVVSDVNQKSEIQPVEPKQVLSQLLQIPVSTWQYKADETGIRHMGPMAQDFAAYGLGEDSTHIDPVDASGVALAGIQGLAQLLAEKDARIDVQQKQIDDLQRRLDALEQAVAALVKSQQGGDQ